VIPFRLFPSSPERGSSVRQQAEELFAQIRSAQSAVQTAGTLLRGQHSQRLGGPGHEFWQYRDFQSGDHSRSIDWKQSGKTDRTLIRQKEKETQQRTSIWLQNDPSVHFKGSRKSLTKYECGAIFALVISMLGAKRHDPVSLSGVGALSVDDLTHVIEEQAFTPSVDDLNGHEIFLLGDFLDPLSDLRRTMFDGIPDYKTVHLIQSLDPVELDLPFSGRTVFEAPAAHDREQILNVAQIRTAYQSKLHAHLDEISHHIKSRGWSYTMIRTGQDYLPPLLDIILHGGEA